MPELKTDYGYFIVLGVIALLWIVRPIQEGEVALDSEEAANLATKSP